MGEQDNTKNVNQDAVENPEIDTAGIYDLSNPFFKNFLALKHISVHLHEVNEILESIDNQLLEYRNCVKNQLQTTEAHDDPTIRLWWTREIQKEMKIFYFNTAYCLKFYVRIFVSKINIIVMFNLHNFLQINTHKHNVKKKFLFGIFNYNI